MAVRTHALRRAIAGFSLVELAVVMTIVAFLLGGLIYTLSAQTEQRNFEETRRRLEQARELLLAYAMVNKRFPCPATAASAGAESPVGGIACTTPYSGWLPAVTIGFQPTDPFGYAVDAWGNRIRYAVSNTTWGTGARFTKAHDSSTTASAWTVATTPADLVICASSIGIDAVSCNAAASVTNQNLVVAIVFSIGKNGGIACGTCVDEAANTNGDRVFVYHTPTTSDVAAGGEFDDQFVWITVGELYGKMIAAGVLP